MYYIYILYSASVDKFYVGHSNNPWQRFNQHLSNSTEKFTGKSKDWVIRAIFKVSEEKGTADKLEKFIKRQKSRKLIERLIEPDFEPTGELALLVRVPHVRD